MTKPILVYDDNGLAAWAFDHRTDPDEVLWMVMMCHVKGKEWAVCSDKQTCPGAEGRYCLDCHSVAWMAKEELKARGYT